MNIELKNKFKYHFVVALLAALTLIFGAFGIYLRLDGIVFLPLIAGTLSALIVIEKRRIVAATVAVMLLAVEIAVGFMGYFTIISLSSIAIAVIIALHYVKSASKSDSALYSTVALVFLVFASAALYFIGTTTATSVKEAYGEFLLDFDDYKNGLLSYIADMNAAFDPGEQSETLKSADELITSFLDSLLAIVSVFSFLLVGIAHKIFSGFISIYALDTESVKKWRFSLPAAYAYFYFAIALLSVLTMNKEGILSITADNLYVIFMYVFAYVGYKTVTSVLERDGRMPIITHLILLPLTALFITFTIPVFAIMGALVSINPSRFSNLKNNFYDRR